MVLLNCISPTYIILSFLLQSYKITELQHLRISNTAFHFLYDGERQKNENEAMLLWSSFENCFEEPKSEKPATIK